MKHIGKIIYLVICTALSILPFFWIPEEYVYTSEEANFINYDIKLDKASTAWTKDNGFGNINDPSNQSLLIPNAYFYRIFKNLGLDNTTTQKLFISFIFLSISVGFGLFSTLFTTNWFIRSLCLLFYTFNFYVVSSLGYTAKTLQLAVMPGIFFFFYQYMTTRRIKYLFLNYIWLFIFQGVFTNLPLAITSLVVYPLTFLFFIFSNKPKKLTQAFTDAFVVLLSILPILIYQLNFYLPVVTDIGENPERYAFTAVGAPIDLILQLRGVWWEKAGHMGINYFNLSYFYDNPFVAIISSISSIIIVSCLALIASSKNTGIRIKASFWLITYLIGVGLAAGFYFFPGFFSWLFTVIPGMVMFREPWAKFIPVVLLSLTAGLLVSLEYMFKFRRYLFYILFGIITISVLLQSYPFVSGEIIDKEARGWKRRLVKIPQYWEDYGRWTTGRDGVLLAVPFGTTPFNSLRNWYPNQQGNSILPMANILGKLNIISDSPIDKYSTILRKFTQKGNFDFIKLGGLDYILTQGDLEIMAANEYYDWQVASISAYIEPEPIATFGDLVKVYKVKTEFTTPNLYTAQGIVSTAKGNEESAVQQLIEYGPGNVFSYVTDFNLNQGLYAALSQPKLSVNQSTHTNYRGQITDSTKPFILVLNQSFHRGWQITFSLSDKSTVSVNTSIPKAEHIIINGFANGWYIDPAAYCSSQASVCALDFEIEFTPQKYFFTALIINTSFAFISLVGLILIHIIKFTRHHNATHHQTNDR